MNENRIPIGFESLREPEGVVASANDALRAGSGEENREEDEPRFKVFDKRFWKKSEEEQAEDETEGTRGALPSYVQQLKDQLEEKDRKLREYIAAYKKEVVEELDKSRERLRRDAEEERKRLRGEMATPMIDVLQTLEHSIDAAKETTDLSAVLKGVEQVHLLMLRALREMGLERIETVGNPFDPNIHEAIALAAPEAPEQENTVVREFSPGFLLDGQVIRAAKVQVAKR